MPSSEITLEIVRILNCVGFEDQFKVEITFLSVSTKAYIAHKSIIAQNIDSTLLLNTSFKISYHHDQNHILCKVSLLPKHESKKKQIIGEAIVDLDMLLKTQSKVLYLPFQNDKTKIIEIHRIDSSTPSAMQYGSNLQPQTTQNNQHCQQAFLKQRYDFLQRITHSEIQMKKNFSQKVYNLLKDVKYARASDNMKKEVFEKKNYPKDLVQNDNDQYAYQTPMRENSQKENNKKLQARGIVIDQRIAPRNPKQNKNYKLMIDSIHTYGSKEGNHNNVRNQNRH